MLVGAAGQTYKQIDRQAEGLTEGLTEGLAGRQTDSRHLLGFLLSKSKHVAVFSFFSFAFPKEFAVSVWFIKTESVFVF